MPSSRFSLIAMASEGVAGTNVGNTPWTLLMNNKEKQFLHAAEKNLEEEIGGPYLIQIV